MYPHAHGALACYGAGGLSRAIRLAGGTALAGTPSEPAQESAFNNTKAAPKRPQTAPPQLSRSGVPDGCGNAQPTSIAAHPLYISHAHNMRFGGSASSMLQN